MTTIMMSAAALAGITPRRIKKSGNPARMPQPKQITCLFVRLNRNLVLTWDRSLGIVT